MTPHFDFDFVLVLMSVFMTVVMCLLIIVDIIIINQFYSFASPAHPSHLINNIQSRKPVLNFNNASPFRPLYMSRDIAIITYFGGLN